MIHALVILLACQLAGEAVARGLGLPFPGPVVGMVLLVAALALAILRKPILRPRSRRLSMSAPTGYASSETR